MMQHKIVEIKIKLIHFYLLASVLFVLWFIIITKNTFSN
jgi:hypothetical protein